MFRSQPIDLPEKPIMRKLLATYLLLMTVAVAHPAFAADTEQAVRSVSSRVVKIFGAGGIRGLHAYGTGFLVSDTGHIVTVWSHVLDNDFVTIVLDDGRRYEGRVLGMEPKLDLAILKIDGENLPHFNLKEAVTASPGTRVLGFSNMFKVATGDEPVSVLHGVISAKMTLSARRGAFDAPYSGPVYVVDAITNNPGSGGGVLTTYDGKLLGMIGKELRNSNTNTWINYVTPIGELRETIGEVIAGKFKSDREKNEENDKPRVEEPRYRPIDFGLVMIPDVVFRTPAYVDRVVRDSLAQQAELQPGDLILFVGDELIQSCRMLQEELGRLESGDRLRLVVRRGEKLLTFELVVPRK